MNRKLLGSIVVLMLLFTMACGLGDGALIPAPESDPNATFALESFAETHLGIEVTPVYAGDATAAVNTLVSQMPAEVQQVLKVPAMATHSYWGLLNNGVALVSTSDCDVEQAVCAAPGSVADIELQMRSTALGTYAFRRAGEMPADAEAAQSMLLQQFPGLAEYDFKPLETENDAGYRFIATENAITGDDGQPRVAAQGVVVGVTQVGGQTIVYAAVALGDMMPALPGIP